MTTAAQADQVVFLNLLSNLVLECTIQVTTAAQADRVVFLNLLSNLVLECDSSDNGNASRSGSISEPPIEPGVGVHDSTNEDNVKTDQQLYEATYNKTWSPGRLNVKSNFGSYDGAQMPRVAKLFSSFCGAISEPSI